MAARASDGVMFSDLTLGRLDETMGILNSALDEHDRNVDQFKINNLFCWHVKKDRAEALVEARRKLWVRGMIGHWYVSFLGSATSFVDHVSADCDGTCKTG